MQLNGAGNDDNFVHSRYITFQEAAPYIERLIEVQASSKFIQAELTDIKAAINEIKESIFQMHKKAAVKKFVKTKILNNIFYASGWTLGITVTALAAHFLGWLRLIGHWLFS